MLSFNCSHSMYVYCLKNKYCILFGHAVRPSIIEARKVVKIKDESESSANASERLKRSTFLLLRTLPVTRLMLLPLQARILFILVVDKNYGCLVFCGISTFSVIDDAITESVLSLDTGENKVALLRDADAAKYDDDWLGPRSSTSKRRNPREKNQMLLDDVIL
uniref:Uncharacterized protein n=1 Tax=Glossina pallidipes TaxID=7398 RepID=A0A1A9ZQZ8_GLOPL